MTPLQRVIYDRHRREADALLAERPGREVLDELCACALIGTPCRVALSVDGLSDELRGVVEAAMRLEQSVCLGAPVMPTYSIVQEELRPAREAFRKAGSVHA